MWKASVGAKVDTNSRDDEDWETDPDFINNVTEQEQRWGSKTIEGSGRTVGAIDMNKLREETTKGYEMAKQKQKADAPDAAYGYGGKFGVEKDRMDRSALGHDYISKLEKHASQTDYSTGFGGKFGVQTDRVDKSAVSWEHKENIEKHASQKDYSSGFGGKFGVERDRQDKSALGWDHVEKPYKHDSQTVGKPNVAATEQTQKPSQLKQKFENLAKQNSVESLPKVKPIVKGAVKKFPPVANPVPQAEVTSSQSTVTKQEPVKAIVEERKIVQPEPEPEPEPEPVFKPEPEPIQVNTQPVEQKNTGYSDNVAQEAMNEAEDDEEAEESCHTAVALYDYQAAADDEISFDPDDIITNIEMIDEGWWRGTCRDVTGLFPANYVQLTE